MSKAFVKENDGETEDGDEDSGPSLPSGTKNYMTPGGVKRMQEELLRLKTKDRPEVTAVVSWAAGNGDRSENGDYIYGKKRLREIDRRIRFLSKRLDNVEIVDPLKVPGDQVRFGATVTVRDEDGAEKTYSIVGIDETDIERGRISWISPLANALFKAREGDYVTFKSPKGLRELEILELKYIELP
ncbi:MAG: transcription elongation factor GreB [Deltaproteobacteria bacterium]|nr:transcription elongation factor GreB [Deltaproteobacteria bacterium]